MVKKEYMVKAEIFQWMGNYWMKIDKFKTNEPFSAILRIDKYCDVDVFTLDVEEIRKRVKIAFG